MIPWMLLDTARVPESRDELCLKQHGDEFMITVENEELMSSRHHDSEEALARVACGRFEGRKGCRVLIGGLGMGYTLSAALGRLPADARVVVAELVPKVVEWNRGALAHLAGRPLEDPRVTVFEGDVAEVLKAEPRGFDAVVLDVDNGPEGFTRKKNDWLYARPGLATTHAALRPEGVLAVWSAGPDAPFLRRVRQVGFDVEELRVPASRRRGGHRHTIWLAWRRGTGRCSPGRPIGRSRSTCATRWR
ncbi:MAG: spermidine synthase [Burkholderiales bacterium]|nr:MAG: spermidine synthase [Burkholderiales bacterium]